MPTELPGILIRESLLLVVTVGGPLFIVLLLLGFTIGILQAATQINDPAVSFLPRIVGAVVISWLLGPWMIERLAIFFSQTLEKMAVRPF